MAQLHMAGLPQIFFFMVNSLPLSFSYSVVSPGMQGYFSGSSTGNTAVSCHNSCLSPSVRHMAWGRPEQRAAGVGCPPADGAEHQHLEPLAATRSLLLLLPTQRDLSQGNVWRRIHGKDKWAGLGVTGFVEVQWVEEQLCIPWMCQQRPSERRSGRGRRVGRQQTPLVGTLGCRTGSSFYFH